MNKWSLLLLSFPIFAQDTFYQVQIEYNAHELRISDSAVSYKIFRNLPSSHHSASLAPEFLIKNHRYFYCSREPDGEYNCNLYLNFNYDGSFANFENDHDYGVGSLTEFYGGKSLLKDKAEIKINDVYIELYTEGKIAQKLFNKTDLGEVEFKRVNEVDIEIRAGRHMKCLKSYDPNKSSFEAYGCKVRIPRDPNNEKIEFKPDLS